MTARHQAVVDQIDLLRTIEPMPIIVGVNSVELAIVAGRYANGVNVRLSSPKAATYLAAAVEAAEGKRFETSGWAAVHDRSAQDRANTLQLDRLILSRLEPLSN